MKFYIIAVFGLLTYLAHAEDLPSLEGKSFWAYGDLNSRTQYDFAAKGKCTYHKKDPQQKWSSDCTWIQDKDVVSINKKDWKLESKESILTLSQGETKKSLEEMNVNQTGFEGRVYEYIKKGHFKITFKLLPQGECVWILKSSTETSTATGCYWEYKQIDKRAFIKSFVLDTIDLNEILEDGKKLGIDGEPGPYRLISKE